MSTTPPTTPGAPAEASGPSQRTSDAPLVDALVQMTGEGWDPRTGDRRALAEALSFVTADTVLAAGVSRADLDAYETLWPLPSPTDTTLRWLVSRLADIDRACPDLTLREAFGYALIQYRWKMSARQLEAMVGDWYRAGYVHEGWLLTAAGVMPEEAIENGIPDENTLLLMAALRPDWPLPHP